MFRVGLTGNIAGGKSAVAAIWGRLGARVVDADELARRAVAPGTSGLEQVAAAFGPSVLGPDGALDRGAMRAVVFRDETALRRLEAIVHPEVERLRREAEGRLQREGAAVVVHEVPLLFEVGLNEDMDVVVLVDAPEPVREARLVAQRGIEVTEARRMIAAQMPASAKRPRSDYIIENDGTWAELESRAARVWMQIRDRAAEASG